MSRNPIYQQYMVGIPRGSEMNAFYRRLAEENGVKVPTYIFQLLKALYEQSQENGNTPSLHALIPASATGVEPDADDGDAYSTEELLDAFGGIDEDDTVELAAVKAS